MTRSFDFNKPEDARAFIKGLRMPNGNAIMYIEKNGGLFRRRRKIEIDKAPDKEICEFASRIYHDFYAKPGSMCIWEDPKDERK